MNREVTKAPLYIAIFFLHWGAPTNVFAAADSGEELFKQRCVACHKLPDIHTAPPAGWKDVLDSMAKRARLNDAQEDALLSYLSQHVSQMSQENFSVPDQKLIADRCGECHNPEDFKQSALDSSSSNHVAEHIATGVSKEDINAVLSVLSEPPTENSNPESQGAALYKENCQTCHTLERVTTHLTADHKMAMDWTHVVARMRQMAPQMITSEEAQLIADYLQSSAGN